MSRKTSSNVAAVLAAAVIMIAAAGVGYAQTPMTAAAQGSAPPQIVALCNAQGEEIDGRKGLDLGLNDVLWVVIGNARQSQTSNSGSACATAPPAAASAGSQPQATLPLDASRYVLYLNSDPLPGLTATAPDVARHVLAFRLIRSAANRDVWAKLLGSPIHLTRTVRVALGETPTAGATIAGTGTSATFELRIISPWRLGLAAGVTVLLLFALLGHVRTRTTLRDNLLPQLEPHRQPYSLGRCQMAFWFVLVFVAFVFLYLALTDYDTLSGQALALMGIASATAYASALVDGKKDSPADKANAALQALGLKAHDDVLRLRTEIGLRTPLLGGLQTELAAKSKAATDARAQARQNPADTALKAAMDAAESAAGAAANRLMQLHSEIQDRQNILSTYQEKSAPFVSQGWFKDLTTDLNGPTLHRLQVVFWTAALGVVFLIEVYRHLAMPPDFSPTLLALMGLSGAGYVGFKYPEQNN